MTLLDTALQIIHADGDWLVLDGGGRVILNIREDYCTSLPHRVVKCIETHLGIMPQDDEED